MELSGYKVRSDLVLYYPFSESDGSVVQDYSTELRDAEIVDASLDTEGKFGSGILFLPEMNNSKILLPEGNRFSWNNKHWTLSTWFASPLPTTGAEDVHALFNEYLEPYVGINFSPKSIMLFDGSSFSDTAYEFDDSPGWHHLVVRSSTAMMEFFVDGVFRESFNKGVVLNVESIGNLFGGMEPLQKKWTTLGSTPVPSLIQKSSNFMEMAKVTLGFTLMENSLLNLITYRKSFFLKPSSLLDL